MPPPASQDSPPKSSLQLLLALVCASIVADYDRSWLARPVAQLIPEAGRRPEWISRAKAKLKTVLLGAIDVIEAHVRSWLAAHPTTPQLLCDAVRGVLHDLITDVQAAYNHNPRTALVGVILQQATRTPRDNERPPPTPRLRI